jgi:hypothetical protein
MLSMLFELKPIIFIKNKRKYSLKIKLTLPKKCISLHKASPKTQLGENNKHVVNY